MTAGTRRNGTSKVGPFSSGRPGAPGHHIQPRSAPWSAFAARPALVDGAVLRSSALYPGRPGTTARKAARLRAGKAVPAAAVAATIAAGAAAYTLAGALHGHPAQFSAAAALPAAGAAGAAAGAAPASAGAAAMITVTTAPGPNATAAPKGKHARPAATATSSAAAQPRTATSKAVGKHAAPAASATATATSGSTTLSCTAGAGLLPRNTSAIVGFLLAHGYSDNAAAGIAGNIYQESKGDPESGGGLIGWTPLPSGYVTGDTSADLETQLSGLLAYNQGWSQYLPALNSAATPADAAYVYVTDFERAGNPVAATREASAQDVAAACGI